MEDRNQGQAGLSALSNQARDRRELRYIFRRLLAAFGPQGWWPGNTPLEVALGAVLTQNASWAAVERAIFRVKASHMLSLARLARLSPAELVPLIKPAGLYRIKARRLHALIQWLAARRGFAGLRRMSTAALREELLALHGIGPETADSILLYALSRPVFVVDAYTRRILSRYGIIRGDEPYEALRLEFQAALPTDAQLFNEYHALLVKLAKTHCRTKPDCSGCPLS
jgi:endonuclease-3 related protein